MSTFYRTVSDEAIHAEWLEIQEAQSDPAQFRPLYNRYYQGIFRYVFNRTLNEDLSADLSAQVFLNTMQRLHTYTFRGVPFSAWLFRIAANEVAQHYRRAKTKRVVALDDQRIQNFAEETSQDDFESLRQTVILALNQVKPADLEIIELRFFEQRPFKEIAELLNITESNAKVRTYRVLERIKKIMKSNAGKSFNP